MSNIINLNKARKRVRARSSGWRARRNAPRRPYRRRRGGLFSTRVTAWRVLLLVLPAVIVFMAATFEKIAHALILFGRGADIHQLSAATIISGYPRIIDGDTIEIAGRKIRLHGMDAPEMRQYCTRSDGRRWACGRQAARMLGNIIGWRKVACEKVTTDRYHRIVAICRAGNDDIGARMVAGGWAVAYIRYSRIYASLETQARNRGRGLWSGGFTLPETWRHRRSRLP